MGWIGICVEPPALRYGAAGSGFGAMRAGMTGASERSVYAGRLCRRDAGVPARPRRNGEWQMADGKNQGFYTFQGKGVEPLKSGSVEACGTRGRAARTPMAYGFGVNSVNYEFSTVLNGFKQF
jgi:hypothetical protein